MTNNLYGVDIDPQAVEVTKLSLLLKVLEGEDAQTTQLSLERILPDLEDNIKCGNSLIGHDFYDDQQGRLFDEDEQRRINTFDWQDAFPETFRGKNPGFDAVIGNPPYIRIQRIRHVEADYLYRTYKSPTSKTDISLIFVENALAILCEAGRAGFISTSQWLSTDYGKNLRRMLANGQMHQIVHFGSLPVFSKVDTYPAIFILGAKSAETMKVKRITERQQLNADGLERANEIEVSFNGLSETPWNLGGLDILSLLASSSITWRELSEFGKAYYSVVTGMDSVFVLNAQIAKELKLENEILYPFAYRGSEIERYGTVKPNARVIYPYREERDGSQSLIPESELARVYPNIYAHLLSHKKQLQQRRDSRKLYAQGDRWYCHVRSGSFWHIHAEKLLFKGIDTKSSVGMLKPENAFSGANCPGVILENAQNHSTNYVLGLLNSKLISYFLSSIAPPKLGGYTRFNAKSISRSPIRTIDFSDEKDVEKHDRMVSLVEDMLGLHEQLSEAKSPPERSRIQARISSTDRRIDALVYELYGLTDEEIELVEGAG